MAKGKKNGKNAPVEKNVSTELAKMKKTMGMAIALIFVLIVVVAGGMFLILTKDGSTGPKQEIVPITTLKDLPESPVTYTRDIPKQTYMIPNGAILFEASIVFYNKECANLYNDITDLKAQQSTEPEFTDATTLGDKLSRSAITTLLQSEKKENLKSTKYLSDKLTEIINDAFMQKYGQEIVKGVLITNHVVQ